MWIKLAFTLYKDKEKNCLRGWGDLPISLLLPHVLWTYLDEVLYFLRDLSLDRLN